MSVLVSPIRPFVLGLSCEKDAVTRLVDWFWQVLLLVVVLLLLVVLYTATRPAFQPTYLTGLDWLE